MTFRRLSIQTKSSYICYRLAVIWTGRLENPQFEGLGSSKRLRGSWVAPIESPPTISQYLSIQSFALSVAVLPQFRCQVLTPQFDPPIGGWKWYQSKSRPHVPVRPLYTLAYLPPFGHNTQRSRQPTETDRAIGIGRLCYSSGGLTINDSKPTNQPWNIWMQPGNCYP